MYDYIILTHIPVFYKVNLYNELAKKLNILVVFIATDTNEKRSADFTSLDNCNFDYKVLYDGSFQDRQTFNSIKKLRTIFKTSKYKSIVVGGWDLPEFWYSVFNNRKSKNCMVLESTIYESKTNGISALIKKIFLSRVSKVFASGDLHLKLLKALGYNENVKITQGVGIINKPAFEKCSRQYNRKFLYVGRLSEIKNLESIIKIFNKLEDCTLTIIGEGEQREFLEKASAKNICFKGSVANSELKQEFLAHDVFILPSKIEPWGLVVEEALYFGMPIVVSDKCGASEIVNDGINGYLIDPCNRQMIKEVVSSIDEQKYQELLDGVSQFSIDTKDSEQVKAYL
ncbi:glycosyltransferase [Francisella adeliensis]|uniref:Glycosyl transferase n=1 Tax=Francisella adeliensis TaxID=2007306 RepID=A0A2Z4XYA3_9GAMM|nr:glycosyltransferase [Francisella adeliensis]AXA33405.1 glycosyl transferase [Francisella adeliensis]MBK2085422.1 glycosyltransferase family 4 protein [Francisella adeliensis]MBK2097152.1 glycosyltransferase family 4 protein [Francisella adeliensis]QIW11633.1 glycosyltransferase [Francisella adeliensis]QIW13508.1 glycosyltransferase [Francisella adeliensis]